MTTPRWLVVVLLSLVVVLGVGWLWSWPAAGLLALVAALGWIFHIADNQDRRVGGGRS